MELYVCSYCGSGYNTYTTNCMNCGAAMPTERTGGAVSGVGEERQKKLFDDWQRQRKEANVLTKEDRAEIARRIFLGERLEL